MQAIILAAGKGTRMKELTRELPKPLLTVSGKSLLVHKLKRLPSGVEEVLFVIGYQGEKIRESLGDSYDGIPLRYVVQEELNGTAGALWSVKEYLTGRFMILMGDDLYSREDMERCVKLNDWSVLVKSTPEMASGGSMVLNEEGDVVAIEEGDHRGKGGVMNTNLFVLDTRIFNQPLVPKSVGSPEYGLPQTVVEASHMLGVPLKAVEATGWYQVTSPEDLSGAEEWVLTH
jgi:NDP-sugar pyrophosphorylase family protein